MKKFLFIISFFCFSLGVFAQTDTVFIVKTDTIFVQEKHDLLYKSFLENRGEGTNHLWKMNLIDIGFLRLNVGYEHRLGKSWSVEGYLSYGEKADLYRRSQGTFGFGSGNRLEFEQIFKYYYNLNRRETLGKKSYGFRGNYFATSFWVEEFEDNTICTDSTDAPHVDRKNLGIKYGIQRRIGNLGYIEFYVGLYYRWESIEYSLNTGFSVPSQRWTEYDNYFNPVLGIRVGFAIDSFGSLRRMIKE